MVNAPHPGPHINKRKRPIYKSGEAQHNGNAKLAYDRMEMEYRIAGKFVFF
jgi:hypothetical protein